MNRPDPVRALAISALALLALSAHAQNCDVIEREELETQSFDGALPALTQSRCLDADNYEDHLLVTMINELTPDVEMESAKRVENVLAANAALRQYASDKSNSAATDRDMWTRIALAFAREGVAMDAGASATDPAAALRAVEAGVNPDNWAIGSRTGRVQIFPPEMSVYTGVDSLCPDLAPENRSNCSAYQNRKEIILTLSLGNDLAFYATREAHFRHLAESRIANAKWDAYFNEARFQWWWEVWANGVLMLRGDDCDRNEATQQREGFCSVPDSQLILLHPDVALSYVDDASSSDELKGAFIVELIGRNRWDWAADGSIRNASGWSVIAAYTELDDEDEWGYGLMYHYRNRFSLGITTTDGELGALLSVDLSDKFFERKEKYKNYLQKLDKPAFWADVFTSDR